LFHHNNVMTKKQLINGHLIAPELFKLTKQQ
jgi:hypothetical protein